MEEDLNGVLIAEGIGKGLTKEAPTLEKVTPEAMQGKEPLEFNVRHVNMGKAKGTWKK